MFQCAVSDVVFCYILQQKNEIEIKPNCNFKFLLTTSVYVVDFDKCDSITTIHSNWAHELNYFRHTFTRVLALCIIFLNDNVKRS